MSYNFRTVVRDQSWMKVGQRLEERRSEKFGRNRELIGGQGT